MLLVLLYLITLGLTIRNIIRRLRLDSISLELGASTGMTHFILLPLGISLLFNAPLPDLGPGSIIVVAEPLKMQYEFSIILTCVLLWSLVDVALIATLGRRLNNNPMLEAEGSSGFSQTPLMNHATLLILFVMACTAMTAAFFITGLASGGHWAETTGNFLEQAGVVGQLFLMGTTGLKFAALAALLVAYSEKSIGWLWFALFVGVMLMLDLLTTGTRVFVLYAGIGTVCALWLRRKYSLLTLLGFAMIPGGWIMVLFSVIRSYMHKNAGEGISGFIRGLQQGFDAAQKVFFKGNAYADFIYGVTEATDLTMAANIVHDFPNRFGVWYGALTSKVFIFWIPRSVWPEKPYSAAEYLAVMYFPQAKGLSLASTLLGELYADFALFTIILLPVYLLLVRQFLAIAISSARLRGFIGLIVGFAICRGNASNIILAFTAAAIILALLRRVVPVRTQEQPMIVAEAY